MTRQAEDSLVYKIPREDKEPFIFDFGTLGFSYEIAFAFRRALEAQMGHTSIDTQSKAFMALRKLSKCLREGGLDGCKRLPKDFLRKFSDWLDRSDLGPSAQVSLTKIAGLSAWCERNVHGVLEKDADLVIKKIRDFANPPPKNGLSEQVLKETLHACYADIDRIEKERAQIRSILGGVAASEGERDFLILVRDLMYMGDGRIAPLRVYHHSGASLARRISDAGGIRRISELMYLSPGDLLPFFVAVLLQSFGNPDAVRKLSANCIIDHPIRQDVERIVWLKMRSGREQFADFPREKEWGAPNLIRRLNSLTDTLRPQAIRSSREKLFICYNQHSREVRVPDASKLREHLKIFIDRHSLPSFQLRDLRRSGGQLVQGVRGRMRDAQHVLNHEHEGTTRRYAATQSVVDQEEQLIHSHQVQFVRLAKRGGNEFASDDVLTQDDPSPSEGMETTFGFLCRDPFSGIAPGSVRGKACTKFFGCASCPGALILLDDVGVVSRLLSTSQALREAKERARVEGWWARFELVYEPTRLVLENELLPAVSLPILERARALMNPRLIPHLE